MILVIAGTHVVFAGPQYPNSGAPEVSTLQQESQLCFGGITLALGPLPRTSLERVGFLEISHDTTNNEVGLGLATGRFRAGIK